MVKKTVLAALLCVNVWIGAALILPRLAPAAALAQAAGTSGNYLMVSGEIQDNYDAAYLIDLKELRLYALYYDRGTRRMELGGMRNLERDFRNKE